MSVFRVNKTKDYVTMGKYHFREKNMSLKAIGMLSIMLSLPDEWDYSVNGLTAIRCESKNTINSILNELEEFGYLKRSRNYVNGKISNWNYDIYEKPLYRKNEDIENLDIENLDIENRPQLNNKELSNKQYKENNKIKFIKPTLEEINQYCLERNNGINAEAFYDFYETNGWVQGKNKPIKDWKACVRTWEKRNKNNNIKPSWFDKEIEKEEEYIISDEDRKRFGIKKTD